MLKTNYKKYDGLACTRRVLFEKFDSERQKLNFFKEKFYKSISESKKDNLINENTIECFGEMLRSEIKKYGFVGVENIGDFFHFGLSECIVGFKHYRDDGDCNKCYFYFKTLIKRGIYRNA
jgi:hypothetical protein